MQLRHLDILLPLLLLLAHLPLLPHLGGRLRVAPLHPVERLLVLLTALPAQLGHVRRVLVRALLPLPERFVPLLPHLVRLVAVEPCLLRAASGPDRSGGRARYATLRKAIPSHPARSLRSAQGRTLTWILIAVPLLTMSVGTNCFLSHSTSSASGLPSSRDGSAMNTAGDERETLEENGNLGSVWRGGGEKERPTWLVRSFASRVLSYTEEHALTLLPRRYGGSTRAGRAASSWRA